MKALPFKIPQNADRSISLEHDRMDHFYNTLHTHAELQLTLIDSGTGTAFIGDRIEQFEPGDVFLFGPNLPHVFRDEHQEPNMQIESYSIFFLPDFLGGQFLELPESRAIKQLLELSARGLKFKSNLRSALAPQVRSLFDASGLNRLMQLVDILDQITKSRQLEPLASIGFREPRRSADGQKINDVFDYLMQHYTGNIKLANVASVANMSPTAFCRYFKHHTRKTYSRFLNEIRIGQACKLLIDDNLSVSQVCYQTGYNNISNFNRQFKKITGLTPRSYIQQQLQET
jgi:AraC-like DNA-binding protein